MTYSFTTRSDTRDQAKAAVSEKLAGISSQQPIYAESEAETKAAVFDLIDMLSPEFGTEGRDITVSVSAEMQGRVGAIESARIFISVG